MQFYEFKETQERVILIGVQTEVGDDVEASLDELEELAETAGAETVAKVIQNREAVHPGTYIGKGKIEEVASLLRALDANGVICDDELSPAQLNNLERELDCKVMDRTLLILDIFAGRAVSSEGKIQVELAQLRYRAARLVGLRESLSRLGGGIGTRGPWREETGNGQTTDPYQNLSTQGRTCTGGKTQRTDSWQAFQRKSQDSGDRRIYECRKVHAFEYTDRSRDPGRGQAFCHTGSDNESARTQGWTADSAYRYRRIYP